MIEIIDKNKDKIQREIELKWMEYGVGLKCNIDVHTILRIVKRVEHLLECIGREPSDYDDSRIFYTQTTDVKMSYGRHCVNFELMIKNGEFYLTKFINARVSGKSKDIKILILPEYRKFLAKPIPNFKYGEKDGVGVQIYGDIARLRFAHEEIEFDYKIEELDDLFAVIDEFTEVSSEEVREGLKRKIIGSKRKAKINKYVV